MFTITAKFITIPKKRKEFQQTLGLIVELTQKVAGCINARYGMDPLDENTFLLTITWDHSRSWVHYRQTDDYKVLMGMKNLLTRNFQIVIQDVDSRHIGA